MGSAYLWISFAIGLAQVADCIIYLRTQGRPSVTGWAFSTAEFVWGGVSIYVLSSATPSVPRWLPLIFVVYLILWTVYGAITAKRHKDVRSIKLTPNETLVGVAFGLFFAIASLTVAV